MAVGGKATRCGRPGIWGTVLNNAVIDHNAEIVQALLKLGANLNVIDKEGFSTLQVAASSDVGDMQIVAMLLAGGADPRHRTKDRPQAHVLAVRKGNGASARLIKAKLATLSPSQKPD